MNDNELKQHGVYCGTSRGFGFVSIEGWDEDVFIGSSDTRGAMDGDEVDLLITHPSSGGRHAQGRILKITKHAVTTLTGVYSKYRNAGFVKPDNARIGTDIHIASGMSMKARGGQRVVVEIISYGTRYSDPEGRVTEVIGFADDPTNDVMTCVRSLDLPFEYPAEVRQTLRTVPREVSRRELAGRFDLRDELVITIDGDDTKDFDDAVSIRRTESGYTLGVHIADVSHYVKENSPLDREALRRGTSVYFPGKVIPMLPKELSNGICSLNEGTDRLTLSCIMEVDSKGRVTSHRIAPSVIRVRHRMTYNKVSAILDGDAQARAEYPDLLEMCDQMNELSDILSEERERRGSIDFDLPECEIILGPDQAPVDIHPYDRNKASLIIENFMLLANATVAEDSYWQEIPFLYRCHDDPDTERIQQLTQIISNYGYHIGPHRDSIHPKEFQKLLQKIQGAPEERMISRLTLRSMQRAVYAPENRGHFGLALKYYCHFTSPIRRYPDLIIHRIIHENLEGSLTPERIAHYNSILTSVATQANITEKRADDAERQVDDAKKAEYMSRFIGQSFEGVISGITGWGIFVELENTCEGLIRLEKLTDDYYIYDEKSQMLRGEHTGKTYRLGDRLGIIVENVDLIEKNVDFAMDETRQKPEAPQESDVRINKKEASYNSHVKKSGTRGSRSKSRSAADIRQKHSSKPDTFSGSRRGSAAAGRKSSGKNLKGRQKHAGKRKHKTDRQ